MSRAFSSESQGVLLLQLFGCSSSVCVLVVDVGSMDGPGIILFQ